MGEATNEVLYVVTGGLPGPGLRTLLGERFAALGKHAQPSDVMAAALDVADGGCEFVELETADGEGRGKSTGVDWEPYPDKDGLWRLGPFMSARPGDDLPVEARARQRLDMLRGRKVHADEVLAMAAVEATLALVEEQRRMRELLLSLTSEGDDGGGLLQRAQRALAVGPVRGA